MMNAEHDNEIKCLETRIKDFRAGLTDVQRKHLDAILKIASDIGRTEEPQAFSADFYAAFKPEKAELIREYLLAAPSADSIAKGNPALAAGTATPASISR